MLIKYLAAAINLRLPLHFDYDDKMREVEGHALGLNDKGQVILRGWQRNGDRPGWRLFILEKATEIRIDEKQFDAPRPGYKADDSAMTEIFAQLPEPTVEAVAA